MSEKPEVEKLLNKENWQKERRKLRALILDCGLHEAVKWGKLCYTFEGSNVAIIYGLRNYCALGFFKGSLLKDEDSVLVSPGKYSQAMRQLRFDSLTEIEERETQIRAYISEAIQAEKQGLEVDFTEKDDLNYPVELQHALAQDQGLAEAFEDLSPGRQRGYFLHISDAKKSETRQRRVDNSRARILQGKGLNDP